MTDASVSSQNQSTDASQATTQRIWRGAAWGVIATIVMSIPMLIGMMTGVAPMPEPIPKALVTLVFGTALETPLVFGLAAGSHLAYGGFFAALLARAVSSVTVWIGLGLGAVLWLVMQVVWLPLLGWGVFGTAVTPKIAVATLVLHLIYGGVLGWGVDR